MIELVAPAKLTWYLEITGVRGDGLHELRSEMTTLDFADRLLLDLSGDEVTLAHEAAVPLDESNLVARALALVGERAGVVIEKNIPVGGGLGGGSADAAAILRYFGGVNDEVAALLGGDVPFCQRGGRALVEGVGERLTPLVFEARDVTLMMPDFSVSTRDCYRAFDELAAGGSRGQASTTWSTPPARSSRGSHVRSRGCERPTVTTCSWRVRARRCFSPRTSRDQRPPGT